ncbi:MAG: NAD(P)/FAD-dependent oxidoreductase [Nitrospinae bacterium]|nr:NAD(P)/FAD-dependent oxidoreductase [Nitrospinota bacterium]
MRQKGSGFDAIVIGSCMGGLTAAALLARLKDKRALVLERHFQPGGQTHSFVRKGRFRFDVGLHYVGQMGPGGMPRAIMDFISGGALEWKQMPRSIEHFVYPGLEFTVQADPKSYLKNLVALFPAEENALRRYFSDAKRAAFWFGFRHFVDSLPRPLRPPARGAFNVLGSLARMTTKEYLDGRFKDGRLKALLASQWPDHGVPPSKSSFGMQSLVARAYLRGGWYPVGGAGKIAQTIIPQIERTGGEVRVRANVKRIIVKNGAAAGVAVEGEGGEEPLYAPIIISDAGAANTYLSLLPPDTPVPFRKELESFPASDSMFVLYICFKKSPAVLGFDGGNFWVYDSLDHDNQPPLSPYFLSFPSLKDPSAKAHTAEVAVMSCYEDWAKWAGKGWRKRDKEYYELKERLAVKLLEKLESRWPGFKDLVEFYDVSTPLTMEYFQRNPRGGFYGVPCVPARLGAPFCRVETPVRNLFLSGSDVMSPGIVGAMMGGVAAMSAAEGVSMPKIFRKVMGEAAGRR